MIKRLKRIMAALGAMALLAGGAVAVAAPAQAAPRDFQLNVTSVCRWTHASTDAYRINDSSDGWRCGIGGANWWSAKPDYNRYCKDFYQSYAYLAVNRWYGWRCA